MKLETVYDVGHVFWVPRCRIEYDELELVWEGETWTRKVPKYVAYAKQKEIVGIDIRVDKNEPYIQYGCVDLGRDEDLSQWYYEKQITQYTEEEALKIAESYQSQEKEYYGN